MSTTPPRQPDPAPALVVFGRLDGVELPQAAWFKQEDSQSAEAAAAALKLSVIKVQSPCWTRAFRERPASTFSSRALGSLIECHHASAAQTKIVLHRVPDAFDLCRSSRPPQLPRQLVALREAGRSEWMSL